MKSRNVHFVFSADFDTRSKSMSVLVTTYFIGAKTTETLADLRRAAFSRISVQSKKGLQPEMLPPTEDSARQHSLRVYLQIMDWKQLKPHSMDPTKWGWQIKNGHLEPVMTVQV